MKFNKYLIPGILIVCTVFNISYLIYNARTLYFTSYNEKEYELNYNNSQYVIPQSKNVIGDTVLLSHAGYQYAKGLNPILINPDHPPLGKYIIGWSILLFHNNAMVSLIFGLGCMLLAACIVYITTRSLLGSSLALFLTSTDGVLREQILHPPMLDIIQAFFMLTAFMFIILFVKHKKYIFILLAGIAVGCMGSTKLYFPAIGLIVITIVALIYHYRSVKTAVISMLLLSLPAFITYALSYTMYFTKGNSLRSFFGVQKWIFLFWQMNAIHKPELFGNMIPLILFNRWRVWWGDQPYIAYDRWTILLPLFFIIGISLSLYWLFTVIVRNQKLQHTARCSLFLFSLWIISCTAYYLFIPMYPRYLMLLYFPIYSLIGISLTAIEEKKSGTMVR